MLKEKVVIPDIWLETVNVSEALATSFGSNKTPSMFHERVMKLPAANGFQSDVLMLKIMGVLPVFFM